MIFSGRTVGFCLGEGFTGSTPDELLLLREGGNALSEIKSSRELRRWPKRSYGFLFFSSCHRIEPLVPLRRVLTSVRVFRDTFAGNFSIRGYAVQTYAYLYQYEFGSM